MSPESRVPAKHPLRRIKKLADDALKELSPLFDEMYAAGGRPSIPPERLLKSMLLMALYTVRSERLFCEQLDYNLLFRWFLDMDMVEDGFDASTFSKNRQRLIAHDVAGEFFAAVVEQAKRGKLMSSEHFSVDGTLIDAWASMKSFRRKDGSDDDKSKGKPSNRWVSFRGEKRSNDTHESKTDSEAKLMRKGRGKESKLCFSGHALMENRNGLLADIRVAQATGTAERDIAEQMLNDLGGQRRVTVGADKNYDTKDFVATCREMNVTPHVTQHQHSRRTSAIDARTTNNPGYRVSQRIRMRCEEIFGWMKTIGGLRKTRHKGVEPTQLDAYMVGSAYNLLRMANLMAASA